MLVAVLALILLGPLPSRAEAAARGGPAPAFVPHEVIVGYARPVNAGMTAQIRMATGARVGSASSPRSRLLHLPTGESVQHAIAGLRGQPDVAYAEPNYIAHAAGAWIPDDVGRTRSAQGWTKLQWNLLPAAGIDVPEAWGNLFGAHRPGGRGVRIAIIDTGVAYRNWIMPRRPCKPGRHAWTCELHQSLGFRRRHSFHQSPDFRRTRFVAPYDFVAGNRYPLDRNGHGTFVAGVVGESTNNRLGLTGIAWGASIMPIRVLDAGGLGDETTIARGIRYAVDHHADVINLSLEFLPTQVSSGASIPEIVSAIGYAHRHGVTVVGAAGNDQDNQIAYPARVGSVISVGATTRDRCLADYSNGGNGLDLVAPGGGDDAIMASDAACHPERNLPSIYQLTLLDAPHWNRFGYPGYYIGTSMSAPEVAATAALIIASGVIGPRPSPDQVLGRLEQTAQPLGPGQPNSEYGYGLIDAGAATNPLIHTTLR